MVEKTSPKSAENRKLIIRNFRNLAPFHSGDRRDDVETLILSRGLAKEDLGGLVILVGANNCGKSNVLDALEKCNSKKFFEEDYTDFTYAEKVMPSIDMDLAGGRYGCAFPVSKSTITYEGARSTVIKALMWEKESFDIYMEFFHEEVEVYQKMYSGDGASLYQAYFGRIMDFLKKYDGTVYKPIGEPVILHILKKRKDLEFGDPSDFPEIFGEPSERKPNNEVIVLKTRGTPIDDDVYTSINEHRPSEMSIEFEKSLSAANLSAFRSSFLNLKVEYNVCFDDDERLKSEFADRYGYRLNNVVYRYSRQRIRHSDLVCTPDGLNPFITSVFEMLGFSADSIHNAYEGAKNLRHKLEVNVNKALATVSDELNDLLNINDKRYTLSIELERENIEFMITCGDDVPLNLDRQSEGFRWLFDMYFGLLRKGKFEPGSIILIDEFGDSLSFSTVKELASTLRRFGRENGITFVLATQNPMAVDMSHMDEIRLLVPMDDGSTRILNNFDHFGEEGDHDVMAPVLSGLTVSRNFMRTENRRTVFVEGSTDYFYLNAFSEMFRSEGEVIDIDFIPMNGLGSRTDDPKVLLGQLTAVERYPLIFTDGDRAGEAFKKAAEKMNIHPSNVSEVFDGAKKEIEDLFTAKDAELLEVHGKSFDTAACLSYRIPSMKKELDKETCDNFHRVIDYIMSQ